MSAPCGIRVFHVTVNQRHGVCVAVRSNALSDAVSQPALAGVTAALRLRRLNRGRPWQHPAPGRLRSRLPSASDDSACRGPPGSNRTRIRDAARLARPWASASCRFLSRRVARRARIRRTPPPRSVWHTTRSRFPAAFPTVIDRGFPCEWSGSSRVAVRESWNTVTASSKETLRFRRSDDALSRFHSNHTTVPPSTHCDCVWPNWCAGSRAHPPCRTSMGHGTPRDRRAATDTGGGRARKARPTSPSPRAPSPRSAPAGPDRTSRRRSPGAPPGGPPIRGAPGTR